MRKFLVLLFFGLLFAVTASASDVGGYQPDVGVQCVCAQQPTIMPALSANYQYSAPVVSVTQVKVLTVQRKVPVLYITAYCNPDYGLNFYKKLKEDGKITQLKFLLPSKTYNRSFTNAGITTTRHV